MILRPPSGSAFERELKDCLGAEVLNEGVYLFAAAAEKKQRAGELVEEIARQGGSALLGRVERLS